MPVLLKASSGQRCAPHNYALLVTFVSSEIDNGKVNVETNSGTTVSTRTTSLAWRHYQTLAYLCCLHC